MIDATAGSQHEHFCVDLFLSVMAFGRKAEVSFELNCLSAGENSSSSGGSAWFPKL